MTYLSEDCKKYGCDARVVGRFGRAKRWGCHNCGNTWVEKDEVDG